MESVSLEVQQRTVFGKKLGALRRAGITPLHLYGRGTESLSLQAGTGALIRTLTQVGRTAPFTVSIDGGEQLVMVRDIHRHPVSEQLLHIDLIRVSRTERMTVEVPVHLSGEAPAAREPGAMLVQDLYSVQLEALPMELPSEVTIDVTVLTSADAAIYAQDVPLPQGVFLVTPPEALVARIGARRTAIEPGAAAAGEAGPGAQEKATASPEE